MEGYKQLEGWKTKYITNLCKEFPARHYKNWAKYQVLFLHAKLALAQQPKGEKSLKEWALLLYNIAWYVWQQKNASNTEKMLVKSIKVKKKLLSKEQEKMLSSIAIIELAYNLKKQ